MSYLLFIVSNKLSFICIVGTLTQNKMTAIRAYCPAMDDAVLFRSRGIGGISAGMCMYVYACVCVCVCIHIYVYLFVIYTSLIKRTQKTLLFFAKFLY